MPEDNQAHQANQVDQDSEDSEDREDRDDREDSHRNHPQFLKCPEPLFADPGSTGVIECLIVM